MAAYFQSALALKEDLLVSGIKHDFLITTNESLITRARNTSVATFLKTDYQYLMFIDGDIEFNTEDVAKLWNHQKEVVCATYPWKRKDQDGVTAWKDGALVDITTLEDLTPVDYCGTGFLMIQREVFEKMKTAYPEFKHEEGNVGECWAFFDTKVEDGIYLSEDYFFCKRWRDIGGEVLLDPSIKLTHWGSYAYGADR